MTRAISATPAVLLPGAPGGGMPASAPRVRHWPMDIWAAFLIAFPVLGTFFAPESYFVSVNGDNRFHVPITQPFLVVCSLYIIGHFIVLARRQRLVPEPFAYAFIALALASMAWSYDPYATFTRSLRLLPIVGLAVLYAQAFPLERTLRILILAYLGSALCSVFMSVAVPSYGLDRLGAIYAHAWRGAMLNKNQTGFIYAIGTIISLAAWRLRLVDMKLCLITAALCGLIVLKAQSTTAVGAVLLALPPTAFLFLIRHEPSASKVLAITFFGMIAAGVVALAVSVPDIFALVGKDATFNGRLPIWSAAWTAFKLKPVLGHAYAFWGMDYPERNLIWFNIGLPAPHSHNSWLDLAVQLGVVGWAIVAVMMVAALSRTFYCWAILSNDNMLLPLGLLFVLIIRSQMEVQFSEPAANGLFWLVWIAALSRRMVKESQALRRTVLHGA